jgi:hypothetical protein
MGRTMIDAHEGPIEQYGWRQEGANSPLLN